MFNECTVLDYFFLQILLNESKEYLPLAQKIIFELNQTHEILDDEVVIHWFKKGGAATPSFPALKKAVSMIEC